jgi:uncharacterized protein with GYD domain
MAKFMVLGKYTADALAAVRRESYQSRAAGGDKMAASVNGRFEAMYFIPDGTWDLLAMLECNDDGLFAISSMAGASGTFERFEVHQLRTAEEADAAIAAPVAWAPPGQGTS